MLWVKGVAAAVTGADRAVQRQHPGWGLGAILAAACSIIVRGLQRKPWGVFDGSNKTAKIGLH